RRRAARAAGRENEAGEEQEPGEKTERVRSDPRPRTRAIGTHGRHLLHGYETDEARRRARFPRCGLRRARPEPRPSEAPPRLLGAAFRARGSRATSAVRSAPRTRLRARGAARTSPPPRACRGPRAPATSPARAVTTGAQSAAGTR